MFADIVGAVAATACQWLDCRPQRPFAVCVCAHIFLCVEFLYLPAKLPQKWNVKNKQLSNNEPNGHDRNGELKYLCSLKLCFMTDFMSEDRDSGRDWKRSKIRRIEKRYRGSFPYLFNAHGKWLGSLIGSCRCRCREVWNFSFPFSGSVSKPSFSSFGKISLVPMACDGTHN